MALALRLALCLLVAGLCIFQGQGMIVTWDCCLSTRDTALSASWLSRLKGYEYQDTNNGCPIKAFVFITVRNRKLCYPLNSTVALKFKELLDNKQARHKGKSLHKRGPVPVGSVRGRLLISVVALEENLFLRLNPSQAELRRRFVSSQQKPSWLESQRGCFSAAMRLHMRRNPLHSSLRFCLHILPSSPPPSPFLPREIFEWK
ncbi:hypothetical protein E2320_017885 [Naja naja]|nr:hypothetical protein E2320_017885 [Naja naja]